MGTPRGSPPGGSFMFLICTRGVSRSLAGDADPQVSDQPLSSSRRAPPGACGPPRSRSGAHPRWKAGEGEDASPARRVAEVFASSPSDSPRAEGSLPTPHRSRRDAREAGLDCPRPHRVANLLGRSRASEFGYYREGRPAPPLSTRSCSQSIRNSPKVRVFGFPQYEPIASDRSKSGSVRT
jgi:hypothetical protein